MTNPSILGISPLNKLIIRPLHTMHHDRFPLPGLLPAECCLPATLRSSPASASLHPPNRTTSRQNLRALAVLFWCCHLTTTFLTGQEVVTLDLNEQHQTIEGWGTSAIGWGPTTHPYNQSAWRNAWRDLGINVFRINLRKEALQHTSGNLSIAVPMGADLQDNISKMDFDEFPLDVHGDMARWLSQNALEPERFKLIGSVWTPPHWMKGPTNFTQSHVNNPSDKRPTPWLNRGTFGDSIGGRLLQEVDKPGNPQQFARYLAAWVKGFEQRYGTPFHAISIQNELIFENPFDSCSYLREKSGTENGYYQYALALAAVRDEWQRNNISTRLMGPHGPSIGDTLTSITRFNHQMKFIQAVKDHDDPTLADFLHIYTNNYSAEDTYNARMWRAYWEGVASMPKESFSRAIIAPGLRQDGKQNWISEAGGHASSTAGALDLARDAHDALVWGGASAWIYWLPTSVNNNAEGETLFGKGQINNPQSSIKYCAYKHFSRYIRPGAKRIDASFSDARSSIGDTNPLATHTSLNVSAYLHSSDRRLTVVLVNMRSQSFNVAVDLPPGPQFSDFELFRTTASDRFVKQNLSPNHDRLSVTVPGQSIITLTGTFPALDAPSGLTGAAVTHRRVALDWDTVENATGYRLYRSVAGQQTLLGEVAAGQTTFNVADQLPGSRAAYRVAYLNGMNESALSLPITVETPSSLPRNAYPWAVEKLDPGLYKGWIADWMGWVFFEDTVHPWTYHMDHGWLYTVGSRDELWAWDPQQGWLFTNALLYPNLYRTSDHTWLYYVADTHSPRQFWDLASLTLITVP